MDESKIARLEQLAEDTLEVAEENNKILVSIQRHARWSFWGKVFMWIVVLALPFFLLGPILHTILPLSNTSGVGGSVFGVPSTDQIKALFEAYRQGTTSAN